MSNGSSQPAGPAFAVLAAVALCNYSAAAQERQSVPADFAPKRMTRKDGDARLFQGAVRDPSSSLRRSAIRWDAVDRPALLQEDLLLDFTPGTPMRIGVNRAVPGRGTVDAANSGAWQTLADGTKLWSLALEASGAQAVRVHFQRFDLAPGTRLVVTGGDAGFSPDVFRGRGHKDRGSFWSTPIPGDVVLLEYQDPTGRALAPIIVIDEISHIYRGGNEAAGGAVAGGLSPCQEEVACHAVDETARDAVGRITFTVPGQGSFLCSGALLADGDPNTFVGYFLTANHCISTQASASTLVVYWFYQTATCGGSVPNLFSLPRSSGATLLATSHRSVGTDSTLLRLDNDPSDGQTFAAWTTNSPGNGTTVRGIHHPGGSHKRYSEGFVTQVQPICGSLPLSRFVYNKWTLGFTEGGSSGSPLFNNNWEVVGQLFGACFFSEPTCNNPSQYNNLYGRFVVFFPLISDYLLGVIADDEFEDNDSIAQAPELAPNDYDLRLVDFDDYFAVTVTEPRLIRATTTFSTSDMDLDLFLLEADGTVVDSSTGSSGSEAVSAAVQAGTYLIRATKTSGLGGDYSLSLGVFNAACSTPDAPTAVVGSVPGNRYLGFVPGNAGSSVEFEVTLVSMHHPQPPNVESSPAPDLSALEGTVMWVGVPESFETTTLPPSSSFASPIQCDPNAMDWAGFDTVWVYGSQIVPSSVYEIRALSGGCDPTDPSNISDPLVLTTARWADVVEVFQDPTVQFPSQPDVLDVAAIVDAVKELPSSLSKVRAQLRPILVVPSGAVNVLDIAVTVDAVKGLAYPFGDVPGCP